MLTDITVEGYQSLRKLTLKPGMLTVVTGATGSGKSSLYRALELLTFNAKGTSYISRGEASVTVGAGIASEGWAVAVTRGARGKDAYRISRLVAHPVQPGGYLDEPQVDTFTKLAGKVPAEVTQLLGLTKLNFAGQFDRPYLLTDSAGDVARQLGELTNVTFVFNLAREANRRKLEVGRQLADAKAELLRLEGEVQRFRGLKARQEAAAAATKGAALVTELTARTRQLRTLMGRYDHTQATLAAATPPELPGTDALDAIVVRRARLQQLLATHAQAVSHAATYAEHAERAAAEQHDDEEKLQETLEAAGVCPTCGQQVHAKGES